MQRSAGEPDNFYAVPELAAHYDADNAGRPDLPFYLRLAGRIGARRVVDIGSGTGLLCRSLAARGHEVIGVEPQLTMLDIARRQPGASAVTWVHGTAGDLPAGWADLAVMTGHVAQYFLDDEAWRLVLTQSRRSLRPAGTWPSRSGTGRSTSGGRGRATSRARRRRGPCGPTCTELVTSSRTPTTGCSTTGSGPPARRSASPRGRT